MIYSVIILVLGLVGMISSYYRGRRDVIRGLKDDLMAIEEDGSDPDAFMVEVMECLKRLK